MALFLFGVLPLILFANPYVVKVLNEFQTDDNQRFELHLTYPMGSNFPLLNDSVITPAGVAIIDTEIYMQDSSYVVIDTSVLSGPYYLPSDTGFIRILTIPEDSVRYPVDSNCHFVPAPPAGTSAAKFYCNVNQGVDMMYIEDWYIDYTPTFGDSNDDYSGCQVSGYVLGNGLPLPNAQMIAYSEIWIYTEHPFYDSCITYTNSEGYYSFDSLLPVSFWIKVIASGFLPDSQLTGALHSLKPLTNFNFYLTGIIEDDIKKRPAHRIPDFAILPNIATNKARLCYSVSMAQPIRLVLYDIAGKEIMCLADGILEPGVYNSTLNLSALKPNVYFLVFAGNEGIKSQKILVVK